MSKKIIFITFIVIVLVGGFAITNWIKSSSLSGLVGSVSFPSVKTKKYTIETPGINPRVYEWETTDGRHCLTIMRDSTDTAPALQCWKSDKKEIK